MFAQVSLRILFPSLKGGCIVLSIKNHWLKSTGTITLLSLTSPTIQVRGSTHEKLRAVSGQNPSNLRRLGWASVSQISSHENYLLSFIIPTEINVPSLKNAVWVRGSQRGREILVLQELWQDWHFHPQFGLHSKCLGSTGRLVFTGEN